jgi:agmatinase
LRCGFTIIKARAIDEIGISDVIDDIRDRVRNTNVYISVDIDVLDPAFAPGDKPLTLCRLSMAHHI